MTREAPTQDEGRSRLLILASHVIQYASPNFRALVESARIELVVAFCSMQGAEKGFDPEFGVDVTWDQPLLEGYQWRNVPNRSPRPGLGRFLGLFNPGLWSLIRSGHYDAVLITGYFYASAWIAIAAAKLSGTPVMMITDSHGLRSWYTQSAWRIRFKRWMLRRIYSLANEILVSSSGGVEYMNSLGFVGDRVVLAPFTVDNAWWKEQAAGVNRRAVRAAWQIPEDATVVIFCAKLQAWKAPADVLEAFARAAVAGTHLIFAGDGPERHRLEDRARELGIAERVHFLGFLNQSQLPAAYSASDVLVLPSLFEPFGLVVNEAMLCGLPVIVSDRVGARFDLVRPGETGFVYRAGEVSELAENLRLLLPDREKLARMGLAAKHRMETWSPREYAEAVVRALRIIRSSSC